MSLSMVNPNSFAPAPPPGAPMYGAAAPRWGASYPVSSYPAPPPPHLAPGNRSGSWLPLAPSGGGMSMMASPSMPVMGSSFHHHPATPQNPDQLLKLRMERVQHVIAAMPENGQREVLSFTQTNYPNNIDIDMLGHPTLRLYTMSGVDFETFERFVLTKGRTYNIVIPIQGAGPDPAAGQVSPRRPQPPPQQNNSFHSPPSQSALSQASTIGPPRPPPAARPIAELRALIAQQTRIAVPTFPVSNACNACLGEPTHENFLPVLQALVDGAEEKTAQDVIYDIEGGLASALVEVGGYHLQRGNEDEDVVGMVCHALHKSAHQQPQYQVVLAEVGAVPLAVRAMHSFSHKLPVLEAACCLARVLAMHADNRVRLHDAGIAAPLVHVMKQNPDHVPVAKAASGVLWGLCLNQTNEKQLFSLGAVQAAVTILQRHMLLIDIVQPLSLSLWHLLRHAPADYNGYPAVQCMALALLEHHTDEVTVFAVCGALNEMPINLLQDHFGLIVTPLCGVYSRYLHNVKLGTEVCRVFYRASYQHSAVQNRLMDEGAIQLLVAGIQRLMENSKPGQYFNVVTAEDSPDACFCYHAVGTLTLITSTFRAFQEVHKQGVIPLLVRLIQAFLQTEDLVSVVCAMIMHVSSHLPQTHDEFSKYGYVPALREVVALYGTNRSSGKRAAVVLSQVDPAQSPPRKSPRP